MLLLPACVEGDNAEGGGLEPPQAHRPAVFKTAAIPVRRTLQPVANMQLQAISEQMKHVYRRIEQRCILVRDVR